MGIIVNPSHVFLDCPAHSVDEALEFLSKQAEQLGISNDAEATFNSFSKREKEGSTAMMEGFAIPHAKDDSICEIAVMAARFADDIDWEASDGAPVKMAIALLVPQDQAGSAHLKLLSQVAVLLMDADFRTRVMTSNDTTDIAAAITAGLGDVVRA